jgi:hypothetical protein
VLAEDTPNRVDTVEQSESGGSIVLTDTLQRQTVAGVNAIAALPLNAAQRIEVAAGAHSLRFTRQLTSAIYTGTTIDTLRLLDTTTQQLPASDPLYLVEGSAAFVSDTSFYGAISPIYGRRYRLQFGHTTGSLSYNTVQTDFRQYFMPVQPLTVAVRVVHVGRYGLDAESPQLVTFYAGYPELVHGYPLGSVDVRDCEFVVGAFQCPLAANLTGSKMLVANLEVHAPLVGLFRHNLEYGPVPIELVAFADSGVTWTGDTRPTFLGGTRDVLRSLGGAARVNAFGLLIVEIAASRPLDRPNQGWRWQVGVRGGF